MSLTFYQLFSFSSLSLSLSFVFLTLVVIGGVVARGGCVGWWLGWVEVGLDLGQARVGGLRPTGVA